MQCHTFVNGRKQRKHAYSTKKRAKTALRLAAKKYGFNADECEVYRCKECRKYHYGHKIEEPEDEPAGQGGLCYA